MVDNLSEIVGEIHKLRDEMRSDVKELHDKLERFHDKTDKKIENQRSCIVEKIDSQRKERADCFTSCSQAMDQKVSGTWFRWIIGFVVIGVLTTGGYSIANREEIKEVTATMKKHSESSTKKIKEIKEMIEDMKGEKDAKTKSRGR